MEVLRENCPSSELPPQKWGEILERRFCRQAAMRLAIEKNFWEGKTDQEVHDFCANEINRALYSTVVDIMETKNEKLIQETHINLSLLRAFMDKNMMIGGLI